VAASTIRLPGAVRPWRLGLPSAVRLALFGLGVFVAIVLFLTIEARGSWDFVLPFRGRKVLAMVVVGHAIAVATVLFQTITANRILTPSIMGFDALFLLIQAVAVFALGSGRLVALDARLRFGVEVVAMILFAGLLSWWLFVRSRHSLHLLVLVGIVFGVLFRSVTSLLQRMIDPTEFAVLQDMAFASFNAVDRSLLGLATGLVAVITVAVWRMTHVLDALVLGREIAVNVGVDYERAVVVLLGMVTALVAISTALVGPITFFGLLVAHLASMAMGTYRHRLVLPAASAISAIALVGGQALLEHVFAFTTSLSIIVEFLGGVVFLCLLIRGRAR